MPEFNPDARLDASQIRDIRRQSRPGDKGIRWSDIRLRRNMRKRRILHSEKARSGEARQEAIRRRLKRYRTKQRMSRGKNL